jgi:tRNA(adenine34) deaminase
MKEQETEHDRSMMRRALSIAEQAANDGEVPVGAVVTHGDKVISERANRREAHQDPTAHAELLAMRRAADQLNTWRLEDCTVYVTLEPCHMCCGTLINARVPRLVYGATDPKAGCVESLYELLHDNRFNHSLTCIQSDLADECGQILKDFFRKVREGNAPPKPGED